MLIKGGSRSDQRLLCLASWEQAFDDARTTITLPTVHVQWKWMSEQIMDTPGVLSRPDGERNEMEALTLASMQHLPTAVVFVMDLSGHSGHLSSLENQVCANQVVVFSSRLRLFLLLDCCAAACTA